MVGRTFSGGRYEILEQVGEGGAALVFRGRDHHLDRDVAIKVLRPELAGDPEFAERFRREATAAGGLCHPHIAQVYDIGSEGGVPFIVMEYVSGGTLRDRLRSGPLPVDEALHIAADVAAALHHAHQSGIVHRDIKPLNILFTRDGDCKVLDFGIARALSRASISQSGSLVGSVHYISPEQARGEVAGPQSDVYSLGVVLYQMLTGSVPFEADAPVAVAMKHVQEPAPDVRYRRPDAPVAAAVLVNRALAKSTEERFVSASAFQAEIERARQSLAPAAAVGGYAPEDMATRKIDRPVALPAPPRAVRSQRSPLEQPIEPDGLSSLTWALVTLTILVVCASVGVLAWLNWPSKAQATPESEAVVEDVLVMPRVEGLSRQQAKRVLRDAGISDSQIEIDEQKTDMVPDIVMAQSPPFNQPLRKTDRVYLTVSVPLKDEEDELVSVPDVVGLDLRDATRALVEAGFEPAIEKREADRGEKPGTVVDQDPAGSSARREGDRVRIWVAEEPRAESEPPPQTAGGTGAAEHPQPPEEPKNNGGSGSEPPPADGGQPHDGGGETPGGADGGTPPTEPPPTDPGPGAGPAAEGDGA